MRKSKTIAIISGKGGTGKSIISTSIGYLLAYCGFKTLLVDMDLFTGGLTYYALADNPKRHNIALRDIFTSTASTAIPDAVLLNNKFCQGNLFLLPSVTGRRVKVSELSLNNTFLDLGSFTEKMNDIINHFDADGYDYILIDTRGGSDLSSIGTAIAAKAIIVVTEADKPSWDMGHVLLDAIDEAESNCNIFVDRLGFVINKNVLPSEAIEVYLKKEWQCPHLATIPLDPNIIRYFQEDKVPIAEEIGTAYDIAIMEIANKISINDKWNDEQLSDLNNLRKNADKMLKANESRIKRSVDLENFSKWNRIYSLMLIALFYFGIRHFSNNNIEVLKLLSIEYLGAFLAITALPDLLYFIRKQYSTEYYKKKKFDNLIKDKVNNRPLKP